MVVQTRRVLMLLFPPPAEFFSSLFVFVPRTPPFGLSGLAVSAEQTRTRDGGKASSLSLSNQAKQVQVRVSCVSFVCVGWLGVQSSKSKSPRETFESFVVHCEFRLRQKEGS